MLQPDAKPGNLKYVDVNGDGVMDDGDIVKLGTWDPKANFGLGASLRFRNWMLDIDTYGVLGKKHTTPGTSEVSETIIPVYA